MLKLTLFVVYSMWLKLCNKIQFQTSSFEMSSFKGEEHVWMFLYQNCDLFTYTAENTQTAISIMMPCKNGRVQRL